MRLILVLCAVVSLAAQATEPPFSGLVHSSYRDGKRFEFALTCKQVREAPAWSPDDPNPPLSARVAVAIARLVLAKVVESPERWSVMSIDLSTACAPEYWYYAIVFNPHEDGINKGMTIPVLMDGTVAAPTVSAWPESP